MIAKKDGNSALVMLVVMGSTLLSRLLGFARNALVSFYFGAGGSADVLNIVLALPNNLRRLLAEGSLGVAVVPELSRLLGDRQQGPAERLVATLLGLQALLLLLPVVLLLACPQWVAGWFFRFPDPAKMQQSAQLLPLLAPFLLLVSASAVLSAIFDAHNRFTLTALTPLLSSFMVIFFTIFAQRSWGVAAVLWGLLAGTLLQTLLLLAGLRRLRFALSLGWHRHNPALRRVLRTWIPVWLCSVIVAVNQQLAYLFASRLPDGSASVLTYSLLFFQLPYGIFYASIARVTLPLLSRALGKKDPAERALLPRTMRFAFHNLIALLLPASLLLILLRYELVALAFQRGAFTASDSILTADMLAYYSLGLLAVGCYDFSQRSFFAASQTHIPFRLGLLVLALDVTITLALIPFLGVNALALANTLAFVIAAVWMTVMVGRRLTPFLNRDSLRLSLRVLLACVLLIPADLAWNRVLGTNWWRQGSSWANFARFGGHALLLVGLLLLLYRLLRIPVLNWNDQSTP